jgi:hypothetical protein
MNNFMIILENEIVDYKKDKAFLQNSKNMCVNVYLSIR